jgi:MFS family permease
LLYGMTPLSRLLPPPGIARNLAFQSMIYAIGNGVFLTGSAVFFVHVVGLTPTQVGVGLSVSGAVSLLLTVPTGMLVDRVGSRRAWLLATLAEAALFCGYPFVRGFWGFLVVVAGLAVTDTVGTNARSVYTIEAVPQGERVRVLAYTRSALNIGFTAGALVSGVALALNTTAAYDGMVLANAAGQLATAYCILRLPAVAAVRHGRTGLRFAALRDRPFLAVAALCGLLMSFGTIFTEVIPLWAVTRTNAPRILLAVLFAVNTVVVVLLQVPAARGAETLRGAARALRWSGLAGAAACPLLWLTRATPRPVTVALLVLGVLLITACELWESAGQWGVSTELPPPQRRGEYLGTFKLGYSAQRLAGPAALTWLAIGTGGEGWLVIAGLFVASALAARPIVAWAERTPRLGGDAVEPLTPLPRPIA